MFAKPY